MTDAPTQLRGTAIKMSLEQQGSGRVDAFLTIRILTPSRKQVEALWRLAGVPSGTIIMSEKWCD